MEIDLKDCGFVGEGDRLYSREQVQREVEAAVAAAGSVARANEAQMRKNGVDPVAAGVRQPVSNLTKSSGRITPEIQAAFDDGRISPKLKSAVESGALKVLLDGRNIRLDIIDAAKVVL
jgi:hypothetical protein